MRLIDRLRMPAGARRAGREAFAPSRLLLAAKTALAAAIAWYAAPLIPFASDEYSYYAPLGVLVSMYRTIADSARAAWQAVLGLSIGIALGLAAVVLVGAGGPRIVGIALVVGVGIAVGGVRALGSGRDWIAIAGVIVLLLGARDADGFSVSYLVTMGFGVAVGVVVNALVVPPLYVGRAAARLSALRDDVAARLARMAEVLAEDGEVEPDDRLVDILQDVAADVDEAERSRRANPLGRRRRTWGDDNMRRLRALERTVRQTIELSHALAERSDAADGDRDSGRIVEAITAASRAVALPVGDPHGGEVIADAERALGELAPVVRARASTPSSPVTPEVRAAVAIDRIIDSTRGFV